MQVVIAEGGFVESRYMPQNDWRREDGRGRERPCDDAGECHDPARPQQRAHDRSRYAVQQQWREHERQQQMLRHVRAEEVGVGQVVQRPV